MYKTTDTTQPRVSHRRFVDKIPTFNDDKNINRIITVVWTFEPPTSILTYGATIYKQDDKRDKWVKRMHTITATERYDNNPIRVKLLPVFGKALSEIKSLSLDWFIAQKLIFSHGTHNTNPIDVRRVHEAVRIPYNFNDEYDPFEGFRDYKEDFDYTDDDEDESINYAIYNFAILGLLAINLSQAYFYFN